MKNFGNKTHSSKKEVVWSEAGVQAEKDSVRKEWEGRAVVLADLQSLKELEQEGARSWPLILGWDTLLSFHLASPAKRNL